MQVGEHRTGLLVGVVGGLVAIPTPVPELAAFTRLTDELARERLLHGVEDHDDADPHVVAAAAVPTRDATPEPLQQAPRLAARHTVAHGLRQARERPVGNLRRVDRDHPQEPRAGPRPAHAG